MGSSRSGGHQVTTLPRGCTTLLRLLAVSLAVCNPGWAEAAEIVASLTVVPPGPVTDQIAVEVRVGLRNRSVSDEPVVVRVRCDGAEVQETTLSVPHGRARLASVWWPTHGKAGDYSLSFTAEAAGVVVGEGSWPLTVIPAETRAPPLFQAAWIDLLGLLRSVYPRDRDATEDDLRRMVDAMQGLGIRTIIITYVEFQGRFFYPSQVRFFDYDMGMEASGQWLPYDAIEVILSQADNHDMHVFLGLGRGGDMGLMVGDALADAARVDRSVGISRRVATELWDRYGHHPSLYGWYLTHEMNDIVAASAYYDPVADHCHSFSPDKPVLVAPDGTPSTTPESLVASRVDVFAYQDAVGAGYVPHVYTYDPERRIASLPEVFADYARRHGGSRKHFWADLEIWEMAGPTYANAYPAEWSRVVRQLRAVSPHVEMVTAYEFSGFLQAPDGGSRLWDSRAVDLYAAYVAHLSQLGPWSPAGGGN